MIAVLGSGAVGCYYGGRLVQHGHEVHFLLRRDYEAIRTGGLRVHSVASDFVLPPDRLRLHRDTASMPRADLVIIALKTTTPAVPLVAPLLHEGTVLLTLQNGLGPDDDLARAFGPERVLGGLCFVGINRGADGAIHHLGQGLIRLGEFSAGPGRRMEHLAKLLVACGIPCNLLPDLLTGRWEKLLWNIPFNGLGAALDLDAGSLIASETGRALVTGIISEVYDAAVADGARFERGKAELTQRQFTATLPLGNYRSSMQIDRLEGRPLEVESILGEPLRRAAAHGVPTPRLAMLYEQVKLVDPASR